MREKRGVKAVGGGGGDGGLPDGLFDELKKKLPRPLPKVPVMPTCESQSNHRVGYGGSTTAVRFWQISRLILHDVLIN